MSTTEKFLEDQHTQGTGDEREDKPVNETFYVEGGRGKKNHLMKRLQNTKIGDTVHYYGGKGIVIRKSGEYITVINGDKMETTHILDTYGEGDLNSVLWNSMLMEARQIMLNKTGIPMVYSGRDWFDLPEVVQEVMNKSGFAGREPGVTRNAESESYYDKINPSHVNKPVDEDADKEKSDVEYGAYGGVTTRTFFDADEKYEDDGVRATKPLSGPSGRAGECIIDNVTGNRYKEDGSGSPMSTDTPGAFNPLNQDKKPKEKINVPEQPKFNGIKHGITREQYETWMALKERNKSIF